MEIRELQLVPREFTEAFLVDHGTPLLRHVVPQGVPNTEHTPRCSFGNAL